MMMDEIKHESMLSFYVPLRQRGKIIYLLFKIHDISLQSITKCNMSLLKIFRMQKHAHERSTTTCIDDHGSETITSALIQFH